MSRLGVVLPALILVLTGGITFAAEHEASDASRPATAARSLDTAGPVDTVMVISVDGLHPRAIAKLGKRRTPALHRLIRSGSTTLNARTARELTDTLPNHVGMVTGRRIKAATGGHGVTWNDDRLTPPSVHIAAGERVASAFDVVHEAGASTATFASKTKFALLERSWGTTIDKSVVKESNQALVDALVDDLAGPARALRFVHLSAPDAAGHARGFMGRAYLRAVAATDRRIASVLRTIRKSPQLRGHTAVILTSDHGGLGRNHRDPTRRPNYTVPFMVWGPGVARGADLYDLNATYTHPRKKRTTYADAPIRNGAAANLALDLLELPPVPGSELNAGQDLEWSPLSARQGH